MSPYQTGNFTLTCMVCPHANVAKPTFLTDLRERRRLPRRAPRGPSSPSRHTRANVEIANGARKEPQRTHRDEKERDVT